MKTTIFFWALALFLLLLMPQMSAEAAFSPGSEVKGETVPVELTADFMSYDRQREVLLGEGNVIIHQRNQTLTADVVEYNQRTQTARAKGNVVYTEDNDRLECDFLEINLESKSGYVQHGELYYDKENFYVRGTNLEKLGENHYRIEDGNFTTCDGKRPTWNFTCKKADVTVEGLAKVRGATFRVKNIPFLYFPYFVFPAKAKRQSGFLMPSIGSSSTEGVTFNNAYYWALSPQQDATFYLDLASKKGVGIGAEYRYVSSEKSEGRFFGYFSEESNSYRKEKYSRLLDREKERWNLFYEGKKDFSDDFFARAKVDLISDREFYKDYQSQTTLRTAERTKTTAFVTKHWGWLGLTGDVEYNKDLLKSNGETVQRYPQIFFTGLPRLITRTPFYFSFDSAYNNINRDKGVEGSRVDVNPRITLPLRFLKHYLLQSEVGYRETVYFDTSKDDGLDDNRGLFQFRTELSTKLMKIYERKGKHPAKFRHTIEPEISYTYIPDEGEDDLPFYDEVDRIKEQNRIAVAFTNRIIGKFFRPDETSHQRELLFFRLGQFYDAATSHDPFSNFFFELRSRPTSFCYLKSNLEYDIYDNELEIFNAMLRFQNKRQDYLRFEYRYSIDEIEEIDTSLGLGLTDTVRIFFENRRAQQENRTLETIIGLDYHPQCWGAMLTYRIRPSTDGRDSETKIMLEFFLKGVGKVGRFGAGD